MLSIWGMYRFSSSLLPLGYAIVSQAEEGGILDVLTGLTIVPQWSRYVFSMVLYGYLFYVLNRRTMRTHFSISRNLQLSSIGLALIWIALSTALFLFQMQ